MEAKRKITAALDDGTGDYIVQKILFPDIFEGSAIIILSLQGYVGQIYI